VQGLGILGGRGRGLVIGVAAFKGEVAVHWQITSFAILLFVSAGILCLLAAVVWRWRASRSAMPLFLLLVAVIEWTLALALETAATGVSNKIFWSTVEYVGITSSPLLFLIFVLEYTHLEKGLTRKNLALLSTIPLVTFGLAATNQWHHLIWTSFTPTNDGRNLMIYGHGPWFWVLVAYVYVVLSTGTLLLFWNVFRSRDVYRRQAVVIVLASILPWLGNILYVSGRGPFPGEDLTPVAFGLTGVLLTVNMRRFRFLDLVPVARDTIIETMRDGVVVLDSQDRIVDINPSAQKLIGINASYIGQTMGVALASSPVLVETCLSKPESPVEICLDGTPPHYLEVRVWPVRDRRQQATGRLILLRDVTARKQADEERERLVFELQNALVSVKTLRGLLPICANCKKVRDDAGYWHDVEEYVANHSEAEFSHGLCPDCMKKLYPWYRPKDG
jgi:PAS domain-containing protein